MRFRPSAGRRGRVGARPPVCLHSAGSGDGHHLGAFSRFCMLLLKASCCISFGLSVPAVNRADSTYLTRVSRVPGTTGPGCLSVIPHGVGGYWAAAWEARHLCPFVMTYVWTFSSSFGPRLELQLAGVLGQQSEVRSWRACAELCLARCSAGVPDAVPICVQDGQNTPPASRTFSLLALGAADLWTGSWEK